jgi:hypothetical protein
MEPEAKLDAKRSWTRSEAGREAKLDAACIIDPSPYTPYEHTNSYRISFENTGSIFNSSCTYVQKNFKF